jgi:hypothetical protein
MLQMAFTTFRPISRGGVVGSSGAALLNSDGSGLPAKVINMTGEQWGERSGIRNPAPAWDGSSYVVAWDLPIKDKDLKTGGFSAAYDAVFFRRVSREGQPQGEIAQVAGEVASPAFFPAAASDGAGTTVIAYERHPKTTETPIKIGVRVLAGK